MTNGVVPSSGFSQQSLDCQAKAVKEGLEHQINFFGFSPQPTSHQAILQKIGWSNFSQSYTMVLQMQERLSWDVRNPKTKMSAQLFKAVKNKLPEDLSNKLMLYCALGTPLDYFHGIDGFFILEGLTEFPVTFDLVRSYGGLNRARLKANGLISVKDMSNNRRVRCIGGSIAIRLAMSPNELDVQTRRKRLW